MAYGDATWGSITLADDSNGDVYSRTMPNVADVVGEDVAFPESAGRVLKVIGSGLTAETSDTVSISGKSYFSSRTAAQAWIDSVRAARIGATTAIATLSAGDGESWASMRCASFSPGAIQAVLRNGAEVFVDWTATFSQYA